MCQINKTIHIKLFSFFRENVDRYFVPAAMCFLDPNAYRIIVSSVAVI